MVRAIAPARHGGTAAERHRHRLDVAERPAAAAVVEFDDRHEGSPPTVAAPTRSLWQTAAIGLRCLIDADWLLRRTGAVATITGVTW